MTVSVIFGVLWWQGQVARLAGYMRETRVELEKCSWPTWDELKGSTLLVTLSIVLLGLFTVGVDRVLYYIFIVLKF